MYVCVRVVCASVGEHECIMRGGERVDGSCCVCVCAKVKAPAAYIGDGTSNSTALPWQWLK